MNGINKTGNDNNRKPQRTLLGLSRDTEMVSLKRSLIDRCQELNSLILHQNFLRILRS